MPTNSTDKKKETKGAPVMHEVDVISLFTALKRNGEAKLSDHFIDNK